MDVFRFRAKARIVAIVDLIISSMSLCICLILLLGAVVLSSAPPPNSDHEGNQFVEMQKQQNKKMLITIIWTMVVFTSITTIIQIVAAVKLLNATQLGKDPAGALKLCIFWRHVCIVFTILLIILLIGRVENSSSIFMMIQVLLRGSAIYIVTQFMKELDSAITSGVLPMYCQQGNTAPIIAGVAYAYTPQPQQQQQPHQQPAFNLDVNAAPPSYYEVVKDPPPMKQ